MAFGDKAGQTPRPPLSKVADFPPPVASSEFLNSAQPVGGKRLAHPRLAAGVGDRLRLVREQHVPHQRAPPRGLAAGEVRQVGLGQCFRRRHGFSLLFVGLGLHRLMQPWPSPRAGSASRKEKPRGVAGAAQRATALIVLTAHRGAEPLRPSKCDHGERPHKAVSRVGDGLRPIRETHVSRKRESVRYNIINMYIMSRERPAPRRRKTASQPIEKTASRRKTPSAL